LFRLSNKIFGGLLFTICGLLICPFNSLAQSPQVLFDKGFDAYDSGNYEESIEYYKKAIELSPSNATYYYYRGVSLSMLSRNEDSILDFDTAIVLSPDYGEAYFERAYSHYLLGENEKAITNYNQAIELIPDYGPAFLNRGSVKFDMGDLAGACLDWKSSVVLGIEIARDLINEYCPSKS